MHCNYITIAFSTHHILCILNNVCKLFYVCINTDNNLCVLYGGLIWIKLKKNTIIKLPSQISTITSSQLQYGWANVYVLFIIFVA